MAEQLNFSDNYAVLFSGGGGPAGNYSRYYNSLKGLYEVMTGQHGIPRENIVVLYADGASDRQYDQNFNDSLKSVDNMVVRYGFERSDAEEIDKLVKGSGKEKFSAARVKNVEIRLDRVNRRLSGDLQVSYVFKKIQGEPGFYLGYFYVLGKSDMSFAQGSTVLSADLASLQDSLAGLSERVDHNDHFFFWTFDHGDFGPPNSGNYVDVIFEDGEKQAYGRKDVGNQARLNGWGDDAIHSSQLPELLEPVIKGSGYSTLAFAQCFSGGMLAANKDVLDGVDHAYGMAAANQYEVSLGYGFAEGVRLALEADNPLAKNLFLSAKEKDPFAYKGYYEPNGGEPKKYTEYPWAYGASGGDFRVFSGVEPAHPLEESDIDVIAVDQFAFDAGAATVSLQLQEDGVAEVLSSLVERYGADVRIDSLSLPSMGSLKLVDEQLYYLPAADFHGVDSFSLSYSTPSSSGQVRMRLEVESVNDAPILSDDYVSVEYAAKRVKFSVDSQPGFLGDFDLDGDDLRVTSFSAPEHGRLKKVGEDSFKYKPDPGFRGRDSFLYQVTDGSNYSVAEVTLTVGGGAFSRDSSGFYEVKADGPDPIVNPLRAPDGSLLSDDSSERWDIVAAEMDGDRYHLLLQGEGKNEGLYQVWTADESGQVFKRRKPWRSLDQLVEKTYGGSFENLALTNAIGGLYSPTTDADGTIFASIPAST